MCVCNSNVCNTYSNKITMSLLLLQFIIYKHNITKTAFTQIVLFVCFCLFVCFLFFGGVNQGKSTQKRIIIMGSLQSYTEVFWLKTELGGGGGRDFKFACKFVFVLGR